jgi:hypothetical protein
MIDETPMNSTFQVLKDRPKITILVTRDSVAAGDDCDAPHEEQIEIYSFTDPVHFTQEIASGYLPSVAGIGHSWDCLLNGIKIATITPRVIVAFGSIHFEESNSVHFRYNSASF